MKRSCHKKRHLYDKAKASQNPAHREAFKKAQNVTRKELKKAHWSYVNGILSDNLENGDTKPFFSILYKIPIAGLQDNQGISPLHEHGQLFSNTPPKTRILSEQLKSVFTRDDPHSADKRLPGPHYLAIPPLSDDTYGVQKLLYNSNPRKASDPDEIPARLLQSLSMEIAPVLSIIFSKSIQSGKLPLQWKKAWTAPVLKKRGRNVLVRIQPIIVRSHLLP